MVNAGAVQPPGEVAHRLQLYAYMPPKCGRNEHNDWLSVSIREFSDMKVENLIIIAAAFWLLASLWLANNGDPAWIWMGLLPAVYVAFLSLLKD